MNRTKAMQEAKEMFPARGWLAAYTKAAKIPSEPQYVWRCTYCGKETGTEPTPPCCGEVHSQYEPECPVCEDRIEWQTGTTGDGTEYSVPKCVSCDWEGDPQ